MSNVNLFDLRKFVILKFIYDIGAINFICCYFKNINTNYNLNLTYFYLSELPLSEYSTKKTITHPSDQISTPAYLQNVKKIFDDRLVRMANRKADQLSAEFFKPEHNHNNGFTRQCEIAVSFIRKTLFNPAGILDVSDFFLGVNYSNYLKENQSFHQEIYTVFISNFSIIKNIFNSQAILLIDGKVLHIFRNNSRRTNYITNL